MGSITIKKNDATEETSRSYDEASIRHLELEEQTRRRADKVETWERLRKPCPETGRKKLSAEDAAKVVGVPVRTLYEWKRKPIPESTRPHNFRTRENQKEYDDLKELVLKLREKQNSWGGNKIHAFFKHFGNLTTSRSMVGRIISELIREKKIKSNYSETFAKKHTTNTKKAPRVYATPLSNELTSNAPGDIVQINTMYVHKGPNRFLYQINATCIYSKLSFSHVFEALTAKNAAYLLEKVLRRAPFEVRAVQTDQGTEFMAEFEQACKEKGITFYINEPHSPTQNAVVERFNKTVRDDFLSIDNLLLDDLKALNRHLDKFIAFFNTKRPHEGIDNLTPMMYFQQLAN